MHNSPYDRLSSAIAASTLFMSIGLRISPTMMSNSSPDDSPYMRLSASAVLSQWRAELSPLRVDVSKPFEAMNVRFISRCVFMDLLLSYDYLYRIYSPVYIFKNGVNASLRETTKSIALFIRFL